MPITRKRGPYSTPNHNNLFHGGKGVYGPIERAERNARLMAAAIAVLHGMLAVSADVQRFFYRPQDD
jgi:hypothetical protein